MCLNIRATRIWTAGVQVMSSRNSNMKCVFIACMQGTYDILLPPIQNSHFDTDPLRLGGHHEIKSRVTQRLSLWCAIWDVGTWSWIKNKRLATSNHHGVTNPKQSSEDPCASTRHPRKKGTWRQTAAISWLTPHETYIAWTSVLLSLIGPWICQSLFFHHLYPFNCVFKRTFENHCFHWSTSFTYHQGFGPLDPRDLKGKGSTPSWAPIMVRNPVFKGQTPSMEGTKILRVYFNMIW